MICKCGHEKAKHIKGKELGYINTNIANTLICNVWDKTRLGIQNCKCSCFEYLQDNLLSLENLYNQRKEANNVKK